MWYNILCAPSVCETHFFVKLTVKFGDLHLVLFNWFSLIKKKEFQVCTARIVSGIEIYLLLYTVAVHEHTPGLQKFLFYRNRILSWHLEDRHVTPCDSVIAHFISQTAIYAMTNCKFSCSKLIMENTRFKQNINLTIKVEQCNKRTVVVIIILS